MGVGEGERRLIGGRERGIRFMGVDGNMGELMEEVGWVSEGV
jgi:hypothetical protein